ncbi:MAG: M16 family metallopeptidase [Jatrophihabitans sp.]
MTAVPELGRLPRPKKLNFAERKLRNGLTVLAVRRPGVPLAEFRLRIPFAGKRATHPARATLLAETILAGTERYDRVTFAEALQAGGASLAASVDADRLSLGGSTLAPRLPELLALAADALTGAAYPAAEVTRERDRLVERLAIARSQAGVVAKEALDHRMWGEHPYALDLPKPDAVAKVTAAALRTLHADRVVPRGATLVVVGALAPDKALDLVESALGGWRGRAPALDVPALPELVLGPLTLIDRPGSVQSALRIGGTALPREHPDAPALQLANLVFGGNFSSRWVSNIREDKGYTYSPRSSISHHALGSVFVAAADVATEVTAPALLETQYELGRIASLPIQQDELDSARQFAVGSLALGIATQAGLASTLSQLVGVGLGPQWLIDQPVRLAGVTVEDVARVSAQYLAPARLVTVVVGDAAQVSEPLRRLTALAP